MFIHPKSFFFFLVIGELSALRVIPSIVFQIHFFHLYGRFLKLFYVWGVGVSGNWEGFWGRGDY